MSEATLFHLGPPELQQAGFFACQWCVLAAHMVTIQPRASVTPGNGPPGTSVNLMESPVFPTCHALSKSTTARWRQHGYWKKTPQPKSSGCARASSTPASVADTVSAATPSTIRINASPPRRKGQRRSSAGSREDQNHARQPGQFGIATGQKITHTHTHTRALATGLTDESRSLGLRQPSQVPLHPAR